MHKFVCSITCALFICVTVAQNVTILQNLCQNNGNPLHVSLMSIPTKGHINPLLGVGQQLAQLGCRVTIPIVETKLSWVDSYEGIEPIAVPLRPGEPDDVGELESRRKITAALGNQNIIVHLWTMMNSNETNPMKQMADLSVNVVRHLLEEHKQGRYTPDILITERIFWPFLDLAEVLGTFPIVLNPGLYMPSFSDEPEHYLPMFGSHFPLNMNYFQRVLNYYVVSPIIPRILEAWLAPLMAETRETLGMTGLVSSEIPMINYHGVELVQTCFGLDYSRPVLPTTHLIGPILPLQLKPVPQRILDWIALDDKDIVYMCFGTVATISQKMAATLIEAFIGQNYRVLWSLPENQRDILEGLRIPENVHLENFIPQRETLLLERVKLFISHTGASSSNEALTSGTPVVCMPFFGDQEDFCSRIVDAGSGFYLDRNHLDANDIREKVHKALHDPAIIEKAQRMKSIMDCGGSLKAADVILKSYVTGIDHLIPNNARLPWYQKSALDLRVTYFVTVFSLPLVLYWLFSCCRFCLRYCRRTSTKTLPKLKTQ